MQHNGPFTERHSAAERSCGNLTQRIKQVFMRWLCHRPLLRTYLYASALIKPNLNP